MSVTDDFNAATAAQTGMLQQVQAERVGVLATVPQPAQVADILSGGAGNLHLTPSQLNAALAQFGNASSFISALATALGTGVMRFATKVAFLAAAAIPATVTLVTVDAVTGTYNSGAYATTPLAYKRGTNVATGIYGEVLVAGIYWAPQYSMTPRVNAGEFGVVGDGAWVYATGVVTGTDNTAALQAAINYALANGASEIFIPWGKYATSDVLHLGYGDTYRGVKLQGGIRAPYSGQITGGVTLLPTKFDRPCLNVQGARASKIAGIAIRGLAAPFIQAVTLAGGNIFPPADTAWLDPAITPAGSNPGGLQQHSAYAAITIDAYANAQPADHYPAVNYPTGTWLAWGNVAPAQYNKAHSSDVTIEHVDISGFAVGILVMPNGDGNGDFVRIRDANITTCVYGVAVCHSQSRNVELRNINYAYLHTFVTGTRFGNGQGEFGGPIENISGGSGYQFCDFNGLGYAGPLVFRNVYFEKQVRIGRLAGTSSFNAPVLFQSCMMNLGDGVHNQIPAGYIQAGTAGSITFDSCSIVGNSRINNLVYGGAVKLIFRGNNVIAATSLGGNNGSLAFQQAVNWTGGLSLGRPRINTLYQDFTQCDLGNVVTYLPTPNSVGASRAMDNKFDFNGAAKAQSHQAVKKFADLKGQEWRVNVPPMQLIYMTSSFIEAGSMVLANDILTFNYLATWQAGSNTSYIIQPGCILDVMNTDTKFIVTAVGAPNANGNYPVTCQQQNNMTVDVNGNFASTLCTDLTLAGYIALVQTGYQLGNVVHFGDFTAGSTTVANVHRGDGYGGQLSTYIAVGDLLTGFNYNDAAAPWPIQTGTKVTAVTNGSPGSLTLSIAAQKTGRFPVIAIPIT